MFCAAAPLLCCWVLFLQVGPLVPHLRPVIPLSHPLFNAFKEVVFTLHPGFQVICGKGGSLLPYVPLARLCGLGSAAHPSSSHLPDSYPGFEGSSPPAKPPFALEPPPHSRLPLTLENPPSKAPSTSVGCPPPLYRQQRFFPSLTTTDHLTTSCTIPSHPGTAHPTRLF